MEAFHVIDPENLEQIEGLIHIFGRSFFAPCATVRKPSSRAFAKTRSNLRRITLLDESKPTGDDSDLYSQALHSTFKGSCFVQMTEETHDQFTADPKFFTAILQRPV